MRTSMMLTPKWGRDLFLNLDRWQDEIATSYEQAMLPEPGTVIVKTRSVTEKYKVSYEGDGTVCLENLRYKLITEEKNDS